MVWLIHSIGLFICYLISNRNKKKLFLFSFIFLLFFYGQRWMVGTDFPHYLEYYLTKFDKPEILFFGPQNFFRENGLHFGLFIFLIFSITLFNFYRFIDKFEKKEIILLLFIFSEIFFASLSQIRQYLSISFLINGIYFAQNRKTLKGILNMIAAVAVHRTALIFIPLGFINLKFKKNIYYFLLAVSALLPFINVGDLFSSVLSYIGYGGYLNSVFDKPLSMFHYLRFYFTVFLITGFVYSFEKKLKIEDYIITNITMVYLILYGASINFAPLYRISRFVSIYEIIFFVNFFDKLEKIKMRQSLSIVVAFYSLIFIGTIYSDSYNLRYYRFRPLGIYENLTDEELRIDIHKTKLLFK